jgi:hypothetical protein
VKQVDGSYLLDFDLILNPDSHEPVAAPSVPQAEAQAA